MIGAGAIGERVIRFARAFDMAVRVYNPSPCSWPDKDIKQVELEEVFEASHFVSLHRPYKSDTAPLIRTETIGQMKRRPYLVNTPRGRLVNHGKSEW